MDKETIKKATHALEELRTHSVNGCSLIPDEPISKDGSHRIIKMLIYGCTQWSDIFTTRQLVALATFVRLVRVAGDKCSSESDREFADAVQACLALVLDRVADRCSSLCRYDPSPTMSGINNTFARQALPMVWDFGEGDPTSDRSGGWGQALDWLLPVVERETANRHANSVAVLASATSHLLPEDSSNLLFTDPPYYYAIAYAVLSDFFYVWLKRSLPTSLLDHFSSQLTPKDDEIIVDLAHELNDSNKTVAFYERQLTSAFSDARRVARPDSIGVVVFASKTTASWEAILKAVIDAGWIITGSWAIDTEMENRVAAQGQARLGSSIHLVCRPREDPDGSLRQTEIGDWRDILQELPHRIHGWLPRLADEGIVGADAIFACLGPALEIYSRHSTVEKASGEVVTLREYLEQVWAAVAKEALSLVFRDADASGLEPDARLTAMWLWTLKTSPNGTEIGQTALEIEHDDAVDEEDDGSPAKPSKGGFILEFDAARKIAQGLGAHLEDLTSVVEVKGQTARLLPVGERVKALFGNDQGKAPSTPRKSRGRAGFLKGMEDVSSPDPATASAEDLGPPKPGATVLDRVHQAMLLFGLGRAEALKRFVVEEGAGSDPRFWKLAQSLSALYPPGTDEKRWIDGVLARKKGLGF